MGDGLILDLFAGGGGWSEGLQMLGMRELGIEINRWACATRAAAGHATIRADVATYPVEPFAGRVEGLIASPPCQDFSRAGKRAGVNGKTGRLVAEVMRWAEALRPVWIAVEQVPDVLSIWREYAWRLSHLGYSTWAGVLCAANYGVPQTRERAFLLAHRERPALPPVPTHCRGGRAAGLFVPELRPWVSMAEALGWGLTRRPSTTVLAGINRSTSEIPNGASRSATEELIGLGEFAPRQSGERWSLRGSSAPRATMRPVDEPAPTLAFGNHGDDCHWTFVNGNQPRAARRGPHEPAPTITFGHNADRIEWVAERPATTVQGDPRIGRPGHKDRDQGEAQFAEQSVRVTIVEAAILQGFRPEYPWQGTKTAQFSQIGNAVPPPLAAAVVGALVGAQEVAA